MVDSRLSKDVVRDLDQTHRLESDHDVWDGWTLWENVTTLTVLILSSDVKNL